MHLHISAAGVLAVAISIYAVLQAAKKAGLDGYISGRLGVAIGVLTAFCSTVAIAGNLNIDTLCTALVAALAAAGLHANLKVASSGSLSTPQALSAKPASTAAKLGIVLLLCALPVGLSSCTGRALLGVPSADQTLEVAATSTDAVANGLKLAQDSLRALHQAGEISDGEATKLNAWLQGVARKNDTAIAAISAADAAGGSGWQGAITDVAAAVGALPPNAFAIKNAQAKGTFTTAVGVLESAVAVINANFGGAQ